MQKLFYFLLLATALLFFISCQNNTQNLLAKKWDCVQIENLAHLDKNFISKEDSATSIQVAEALKSLSWSFNKNNTYQCSIGQRVTVQGTYEITNGEKNLICTPITKNNINNYLITTISENEMILTTTGIKTPLVLHFRPN